MCEKMRLITSVIKAVRIVGFILTSAAGGAGRVSDDLCCVYVFSFLWMGTLGCSTAGGTITVWLILAAVL